MPCTVTDHCWRDPHGDRKVGAGVVEGGWDGNFGARLFVEVVCPIHITKAIAGEGGAVNDAMPAAHTVVSVTLKVVCSTRDERRKGTSKCADGTNTALRGLRARRDQARGADCTLPRRRPVVRPHPSLFTLARLARIRSIIYRAGKRADYHTTSTYGENSKAHSH